MATCFGRSLQRGGNKLLLLRGFYNSPKTISRLALPSTSLVKPSNTERCIHTTSTTVAQKELFELPLNPKQGSKHWLTERVVAVGLLGAIPVAVFYPSPLVDYSLAVLLPLHAFWGVNAIIGDYMYRPLAPLTKGLWAITCVLTTAGLFYLNVNDVGVSKICGMILTL